MVMEWQHFRAVKPLSFMLLACSNEAGDLQLCVRLLLPLVVVVRLLHS